MFPLPVKPSTMWTFSSVRPWPNSCRSTSSAERKMNSTISTGVWTMPSLSTVRLKAVAKKFSYSFMMIAWRPSAVLMPSTYCRTES